MRAAKCGNCEQLFEIPEDQNLDDYVAERFERGTLTAHFRAQPMLLCPPCRQAARIRGQEPPPAEEAAEPQEQDSEEEEAQT